MKIKALVENTSFTPEFKNEHGLSLYIETVHHKILFDLGQTGLFLENAKKLDVDVKDVDIVVISHGHNDHGGALKQFLENNTKAKIYINKHAFETHLSIHEGIQKDIGLDKDLMNNEQIILVDENLKIDDELFIYSDIKNTELLPSSNSNLYKQTENSIENDDFMHEQNLIITEHENNVLIAGCAHRGIINIVNRCYDYLGKYPNYCISGFHLTSNRTKHRESDERIYELGQKLLDTGVNYFTCHCTGLEAFGLLKVTLGDNLHYLSTGMVINL